MMDRRGFVVSVGSGIVALGPQGTGAQPAVQVTATPTLFHGHPDGATTLVRFEAAGVDAPAGRLRVHDLRTGRQLGTAGMIRRGDRLTGELWLPLTAPARVRSDLETPGRRSPLRTVHQLTPTPRWRILWLTLAAPEIVRDTVTRWPPLLRGVEAARLVPAGVRVNPWRPLPPDADHLDLVRLTMPAAAVGRATGVPLGRLALVDGSEAPHLGRALRGAGVEVLVHRDDIVDPAALDLAGGRAQAAPLIEAWLHTLDGGDEASPIAVAIGTDPAFAVRATAGTEDWNGAFAYPRIAVGDGDEVVDGVRGVGGSRIQGDRPTAQPLNRPTGATGATGADAFEVLGRLVSPADPTRGGIASRFAFPVGGTLVFNPAPFGRSDVVTAADGQLRLVTDVPGLGYAFMPDAPPPAVSVTDDASGIETRMFRVAVERSGGSIVELVHRDSGRLLVRAGGTLNGLSGAVLSAVRRERITGIGERLIVRRTTRRHVLQSTITAYDALPWVDVENVAAEGPPGTDAEWTWEFEHAVERVTWEVAGGTQEALPPMLEARVLRWAALQGAGGTVLLGSATPAALTLEPGGAATVRTALASRFRVALRTDYLLPDDPWRFGFGMLSLTAVVTSGGGDRSLPTFGRLLDVGDPTVAILAIRPADDGVGVMVWLQELGGPSRDIAVRPGILAFDGALLTDLAERDQREAAPAPGGGILVPIEAAGWAAVRLFGVRLAS
jgi:hypothetical protein